MLCFWASLLTDDMYTYPTTIIALFSHSQIVGVEKNVAVLPREEGLQGLHFDALAVVPLRLLVAAQLGDAPRQLAVRGRINRQHKKMMRSCQPLMLAMYMLVHGDGLEKITPTALRHPLPSGESCSGPRHSKCCGTSTMTPKST